MKKLEDLLVQVRRIAAHRAAGAEKEIRREYQKLLGELKTFIGEASHRLSPEDTLDFATLQRRGEYARFIEEVEEKVISSTAAISGKTEKLVKDVYQLCFQGMQEAVEKSAGNSATLHRLLGDRKLRPEMIKAAVQNPVSGLTLKDTLEKRRGEIVYGIKRDVGIGLMNGDRYDTVAKRLTESLDGDYNKAVRIVRTETHRVRESGFLDSARELDDVLQEGESGLRMVKKWLTMKDERVRPRRGLKGKAGKSGWSMKLGRGSANHVKMHGQIVLAEEPFDLGNGITAQAPGQSKDAGNDINCRCMVAYDLMEDGEYFEATGKHFPEKGKGLDNAYKHDIIQLEDTEIGRSVGAKAKNYDVHDLESGEILHFVEGSRIQNVNVFAGNGTRKALHEGVAEGLTEEYGGSVSKWQHAKGNGTLDCDGEERPAEIHWFQEESVGKVKFKVKRWLDEG